MRANKHISIVSFILRIILVINDLMASKVGAYLAATNG